MNICMMYPAGNKKVIGSFYKTWNSFFASQFLTYPFLRLLHLLGFIGISVLLILFCWTKPHNRYIERIESEVTTFSTRAAVYQSCDKELTSYYLPSDVLLILIVLSRQLKVVVNIWPFSSANPWFQYQYREVSRGIFGHLSILFILPHHSCIAVILVDDDFNWNI